MTHTSSDSDTEQLFLTENGMKKDALPDKNDFTGWIKRLEKLQSDLVLEAIGSQILPDIQRNALSKILHNYIVSRANFLVTRDPDSGNIVSEIEFHFSRDDWRQRRIQKLKENAGDAMALGFDSSLTDAQRARFYQELGRIIGLFGEHGTRPKKFPYRVKVRQMQCAQVLIAAIVSSKWPSIKELVEGAKRGGNNYSAKDFSELAAAKLEDGTPIGFKKHLKKEKPGKTNR